MLKLIKGSVVNSADTTDETFDVPRATPSEARQAAMPSGETYMATLKQARKEEAADISYNASYGDADMSDVTQPCAPDPITINAKIVGRDYFFGVMWDTYSPQVEAQLTKDLIGICDQAQRQNLSLFIVTKSSEADRLLLAMGVKRVPLSVFATMYILYRTDRDTIFDVPEHATTVLEHDMVVETAAPVLDPGTHSGYQLTPQGRVAPPRIGINRPAPNSSAKPDYALIMLWS